MQRDIPISELGLQWILNAYTLTLAVLVLAGGKIGDMWGLKKSFCLGIFLFAGASALCAIANSEVWLIFSRTLQGVGGAFLLPATQGIIISSFPPHQRGKALGLFVSIGSIFLALGPLIGGSLTTYLSWRFVFLINLPIALVGFLLTLYAVPKMEGKKATFDYRGFLILAVGIASLVIALMQAQKWGWSSTKTLSLFTLGMFSLIFLFKRKHKSHASILDFELMGKKSFIASASAIFGNQCIGMITVFWAIYFQNILGFSATKAGSYSFLANVPVLIAAPIGGYLVDKYGPRLPVMSGFSCIVFSLSWFLVFLHHENIWLLLPTLLTFGFGVALIYTPSFVSLMNDVPAEKRGIASGTTSTLRQFSSSMGLAIFGTLYGSIYFGDLKKFLQVNPETTHLNSPLLEGLLSKSSTAVNYIHQLSQSNAAYVVQSAKASFLNAFFAMNLTAVIIALISVIIAWRLMKNKPVIPQ
jgi:EmrB/QacA subfamily drug resistance transporter